MRVELSTDDLSVIKQALDNITIQGKDAHILAKLLDKLGKAFEKAVEKESNG